MSNLIDREAQALRRDLGRVAEEAHALWLSTADVASDKVSDARKNLALALESGRETYGRVRAKVVEDARMADEAIFRHPYQAVAAGLAVGVLFGYLVAQRWQGNRG